MEKHVSRELKITFLVHAILAAILGLIYLLVPAAWGNLIKWPIKEAPVYRLVGAALLAFAASSWLAYKEPAWEKVRIVVEMEIVWTILGTIVMLEGLIRAGLPAIAWLFAVILAGFAAAFSFFYSRK